MLVVESVQKTYENQPLLRGVSFTVNQGETVCLLGPSGSGKSTLLRIIAGLEQPDRGRVLWDGRDLGTVAVHLRQFGFMFQDYALFPHRNVAQNVAFGLRMQRLQQAEINQRVTEALEKVNMSAFAQRRVTDLSGGEQQRVALARALAPRPKLLMLDEPLGALDRSLREQLLNELRSLLHATGIPAIYVTHDQEEAYTIADRMILLHDGVVQQSGTPSELYHQPNSTWVATFLGLTNQISGEVVSLVPFQVKMDIGTWNISNPPKSELGNRVMVLVRPSGTEMTTRLGWNTLSGRVVDCVFIGENFRVDVQLANQKVFRFSIEKEIPVGEFITLNIPPDEILCLLDEAQHG